MWFVKLIEEEYLRKTYPYGVFIKNPHSHRLFRDSIHYNKYLANVRAQELNEEDGYST